jgi:hypothetical protein
MPSSADLLTAFESCNRRGVWSRDWQRRKLLASEMVRRAVSAALLTSEREDYGELAGETVIELAAHQGMDAEHINIHRAALNHAAIADLIATTLRKPGSAPWENVTSNDRSFVSSAAVNSAGDVLHRFLPVGNWNAQRAEFETQSWYALGEVCMHKMPMQMIVAQMGTLNGGRRHGYWSKALLHPQRSSLRFRKRSSKTIDGFKETWIPVWREDHDEIDRQTWLQAMFEDDVLQESLIVVDIPYPEESEAQRIREIALRKLDVIARTRELPDKQLSTCRGPLAPCPFRLCCWGSQPEEAPTPEDFDAAI